MSMVVLSYEHISGHLSLRNCSSFSDCSLGVLDFGYMTGLSIVEPLFAECFSKLEALLEAILVAFASWHIFPVDGTGDLHILLYSFLSLACCARSDGVRLASLSLLTTRMAAIAVPPAK
ncbi:MAG: hypothetical protein R3E34_10295 [Rhodocyclaceae bacterium]